MSSWSVIPEHECDPIWDRFYSDFVFSPSVSSFPGIREPVPSVTFSISSAFASPGDPEHITDDLDDVALRVLTSIASPTGRVIALDWQHECFYFSPNHHDGNWMIPTFPNGDYYIFLSEDMTQGWFGHPWEQTICVFGHRAISSLELGLPMLFASPVRRDGHPIT